MTSERDLRTQIFEFQRNETRTKTVYQEHQLTCLDYKRTGGQQQILAPITLDRDGMVSHISSRCVNHTPIRRPRHYTTTQQLTSKKPAIKKGQGGRSNAPHNHHSIALVNTFQTTSPIILLRCFSSEACDWSNRSIRLTVPQNRQLKVPDWFLKDLHLYGAF